MLVRDVVNHYDAHNYNRGGAGNDRGYFALTGAEAREGGARKLRKCGQGEDEA